VTTGKPHSRIPGPSAGHHCLKNGQDAGFPSGGAVPRANCMDTAKASSLTDTVRRPLSHGRLSEESFTITTRKLSPPGRNPQDNVAGMAGQLLDAVKWPGDWRVEARWRRCPAGLDRSELDCSRFQTRPPWMVVVPHRERPHARTQRANKELVPCVHVAVVVQNGRFHRPSALETGVSTSHHEGRPLGTCPGCRRR